MISYRLHEAFYFEPKARWNLTCKLYRSGPSEESAGEAATKVISNDSNKFEPLMCVLKSTHRPGKAWCAIFNGTETAVIEASRSGDFEVIISKCKNLWLFRQSVIISGKTYVCGNYKIRGGIMSIGSTPKGVVLQVRCLTSSLDYMSLVIFSTNGLTTITKAESSFCPVDDVKSEAILLKDLLRQILQDVRNLRDSDIIFIPPETTDPDSEKSKCESNYTLKQPNTERSGTPVSEISEVGDNSTPGDRATTTNHPVHSPSASAIDSFWHKHEAYQIFSIIKEVVL